MKRILFFLLVIVTGCVDDDSHNATNQQYITIMPHNSDNELYVDVPVQFNVHVPFTEAVTGVTWEFGDGEVFTNPSVVPEHHYAQSGNYNVIANITTNKGSYNRDTTITVIQPPVTIGDAMAGERARRIHRAGNGRLAIIYEVTGNTSVISSKLMIVDSDLRQEGETKDLELGWLENVGRSAITSDNKLCILIGGQLLVYSLDGVRLKNYYLQKSGRDIRIDGDKVSVLCDSADFSVVATVNLGNDHITTDRQQSSVDGMVLNGLFFNSDAGILGSYSNNTNTITLLQGIGRDGSNVFSTFFQEPNFIRNVTPVSSGTIINAYPVDYSPLKLVKLDRNNRVQWTNYYPITPSFYAQYLGDDTIIKEYQGYFYIFFDNMRCIKIHEESGVVWDRYFYPKSGRLNAVEVTENGEFIMIGTRHLNPDVDQDTMQERDMIVIKIDSEGRRIK